MKILHSISHALGLYSPYKDTFIQDDWVAVGDRCPTCNKISNLIKLVPASFADRFIKLR